MRSALLLSLAITLPTAAQWTIQESHTSASLRGIQALGNGVAWASGSNGTVLRTVDGGKNWQACAVPPGAEKLDFRGVQAFDEKTAIVMSSGKGDLSRLYKTSDRCQTWSLLFTNPEPEGFWDGIVADTLGAGAILIGDPVDGHFALFASANSGLKRWFPLDHPDRAPKAKLLPPHSTHESLFAASNSILHGDSWNGFSFVTGGTDGSFFYTTAWHTWPADILTAKFVSFPIPLAKGESAGAFSFTSSPGCNVNQRDACAYVFVGGDYKKPDEPSGTAAYSVLAHGGDNPGAPQAAQTPPRGYRSAVAYDPANKLWITVGPNGTDISTDDGRNWRPLRPTPSEAPDADQHWNALSLPFVVGAHGRIGILSPDALKQP